MAEFDRRHLTQLKNFATRYFGNGLTPTISYRQFVSGGENFVTINGIPFVITHINGNNYTFLIRGRLADYPFSSLATLDAALAQYEAEPPP